VAGGLERAVALGERIRDRIEEADWDDVAQLESERRRAIESLCTEMAGDPRLADALGALQKDTGRILEILTALRDAAEQDVKQLGTGRRALSAYLRNG
jgi:phytoene/squalene synthetase